MGAGATPTSSGTAATPNTSRRRLTTTTQPTRTTGRPFCTRYALFFCAVVRVGGVRACLVRSLQLSMCSRCAHLLACACAADQPGALYRRRRPPAGQGDHEVHSESHSATTECTSSPAYHQDERASATSSCSRQSPTKTARSHDTRRAFAREGLLSYPTSTTRQHSPPP